MPGPTQCWDKNEDVISVNDIVTKDGVEYTVTTLLPHRNVIEVESVDTQEFMRVSAVEMELVR